MEEIYIKIIHSIANKLNISIKFTNPTKYLHQQHFK